MAAGDPAGLGFQVVGQTAVQAALRSLVRDTGGALLLKGGAGLGKTTLLDQVARQRRDRMLLRTTAIESEVELPFATLADVVRPLRDRVAELPPVQADALRGALALSDGPPPAPYAICAATLTLLSTAGLDTPLLVLVDDLHWVDASSKQVLLFVARRLAEERVSMVLASRPYGLQDIDHSGIKVVDLQPLSPHDSVELIRARAREMELYVAQQVARQAGGNPLALVETARALTTDQRRGLEPVGELVPAQVTDALWGSRLDQLSYAAVGALLLVATARTQDLSGIESALRHQGMTEDDLVPAEAAGLIELSGHTARLRHPLVRSAVLNRATARRLQQANRTWAAVCPAAERPWFLAAATHPPDDNVAKELDEAAAQALRRGAFGTAAEAAVRAADFATDETGKASRLAAAAGWSLMGDAPHEAVAIGERALQHTSDPAMRARIDLVLGRAVTWLGDVLSGHERFVEAATTVPGERVLAAQLWAEAIVPAAMSARIDLANADADTALDRIGSDPKPLGVVAGVAAARILAGRVNEATALLDGHTAAFDAADPVADLQPITLAGHSRTWTQQTSAARLLLDRAVAAARHSSAPLVLPYSLGVRSELDRWTGHWTAAYADAFEAIRWAQELAQRGSTGFALSSVAYIDAARGDGARCRERLVELRRTIAQLDIASFDVSVAAVLGLCLLGENDIEAAASQLELAHRRAIDQGLRTPTVVPYAGDLIEVLFRAGRTERALEIVSWLEESARLTGLPWPAAVAARGRGLAASTPDGANAAFAAAYEALERGPAAFDLSRTRLCHGEVLRRLHRPTDARTHLETALDGFEALGAEPWSQRALSELAATGKRRPPHGGRPVELTPQEAQVANAVASGLSNPEVAAALFVSRKTVEAHLSRVYRKLGVRSRTELTLRLNDVTIR
jgi:DNA-binding CsgD family transcriptional regulator/tetratricopeptide (TPR) repeat protein